MYYMAKYVLVVTFSRNCTGSRLQVFAPATGMIAFAVTPAKLTEHCVDASKHFRIFLY
jgi:hypothetical protein